MTIDDRIEACRPTKASALCVRFNLDRDGQCTHCHRFVDEWGSYERAALVELKRLGITDMENVYLQSTVMTDTDRYAVWFYEAIVWTIARVREHEKNIAKDPKDKDALRFVLRGLLQTSEYHGYLRTSKHMGTDATDAIKNWLENQIAPRE